MSHRCSAKVASDRISVLPAVLDIVLHQSTTTGDTRDIEMMSSLLALVTAIWTQSSIDTYNLLRICATIVTTLSRAQSDLLMATEAYASMETRIITGLSAPHRRIRVLAG